MTGTTPSTASLSRRPARQSCARSNRAASHPPSRLHKPALYGSNTVRSIMVRSSGRPDAADALTEGGEGVLFAYVGRLGQHAPGHGTVGGQEMDRVDAPQPV